MPDLSRLLAVVLLAALPTSAGNAAAQTSSQTTDPRFFSQTGYRIDSDAFWNFFQQRGNVRTFGYPTSRTFILDGFQVQIFQREIMQLQPDGGVQTLNILDPGLMPYTQINGSTYPAPDPTLVAATPQVSDPNYDADIQIFIQNNAPNTFDGQPVDFGSTFYGTVTAQDAPDAPDSLLPAQQVEWSAVETAPGVYDWSQVDGIVNAAQQSGLRILFSVEHAPTFYQRSGGGLIPSDPNTYRTFMQTMAGRYAGRVQAYEIWNEENLSREMGVDNVDPASYLPILETGASGVRAGDPAALVLLGAPSPTGANIPGQVIDDLSYLQQLYALNTGEVKGFYDALSAHPSGFSNPPNCTPATPQCSLSGGFNNDDSFFAFTRVGEYRSLMVQQGEDAKLIWFTEFGYCSNPTPPPGFEYCASVSEQNQANFLVQAFMMARNLNYVGGMMQWNLNFQESVPQTDEKWGFGIVRSDMSARPAYAALLEMPKP